VTQYFKPFKDYFREAARSSVEPVVLLLVQQVWTDCPYAQLKFYTGMPYCGSSHVHMHIIDNARTRQSPKATASWQLL
jgi:hypothetical protein